MLSIEDSVSLSRALNSPLDEGCKALLRLRCSQLGQNIEGQVRFAIVQPDDTADAVEQALGFDPMCNPADGTRFGDAHFTPGYDWVEEHDCCWEAAFVFTDDGFGHVLIVPKGIRAGSRLIELFRSFCALAT